MIVVDAAVLIVAFVLGGLAMRVVERRRAWRREDAAFQRSLALGRRVTEAAEKGGVHGTGTVTVDELRSRLGHG